MIKISLFSIFLFVIFINKSFSEDWSNNYNQAELLFKTGKYSQALDFAQKALEQAEKTYRKQHLNYLASLNLLAQVYFKLGKYNQSELTYLKALKYFSSDSGYELKNYLSVLKNILVLYMQTGDYENAESIAGEMIMKYNGSGDTLSKEYASVISNYAAVKASMGNFRQCETLLIISIAIYKSYNDTSSQLMNLSSLYKLYLFSDQNVKAETIIREFINMSNSFNKNDKIKLAENLNKLAEVLLKSGKTSESLSIIDSALKIYNDVYGNWSNKIIKYITCLNNKAILLDILNKAEANQVWDECLDAYYNYIKNEFAQSGEKYNRSDSKIIAEYIEIFNSFAIKNARKNPELLIKMMNNQLIVKSSVLQSSTKLLKNLRTSSDASVIKLYNDWKNLRDEILDYYSDPKLLNTMPETIFQMEKDAEKLESDLAKKSIEFSKSKDYLNVGFEDIKKALKPGEAAIEITRFRDFDGYLIDTAINYAFLIVRHDSKYPELVLLKNGTEIENNELRAYYKAAYHDLYYKDNYLVLWGPVMEKLDGVNRVFLSSDGIYNRINLNTLQYESRKYLIDTIEIIQLTNLRDLANKFETTTSGSKSALLIGAPKIKYNQQPDDLSREFDIVTRDLNIDCKKIPELPNAEIELDKIDRILKSEGWSVITRTGISANKESVRSVSNPNLLHFATHGFYQPVFKSSGLILNPTDEIDIKSNPLLNSGLMLAKLPSDESLNETNCSFDLIKSYEIVNLDLGNTDLVVVSACQSGLGSSENSAEGIYGLQRAFLLAGAKALIVSLWNVNDIKTRIFMIELYSRWVKEGNILKAFTETQKEMKKKYEFSNEFRPWEWGAFVLILNSRID